MTIDFSYKDEGAGFILINEGLGPAIIRSFEVFVDNKPQLTWHMLSETLQIKPPDFWRVPSHSSVWATDDKEPRIFWINNGTGVNALKKEARRIEMNVCYCSMYDECWVRTRFAELPQKTSCEKSKNQLVDKSSLRLHEATK